MASHGATYYDGTKTYGGFSDLMVIDEQSVVRIPDNMPADATAPPLCAAITVYSPLKYFELDKHGVHVGIVGLGPMAVKFANAFGLRSLLLVVLVAKRMILLSVLVLHFWSAMSLSSCRWLFLKYYYKMT